MHQRMKETIAKGFTSIHHVTRSMVIWDYRECVLAIQELAGKHDGKSMISILLEIIEEFKLHAKVSISWIGINFS